MNKFLSTGLLALSLCLGLSLSSPGQESRSFGPKAEIYDPDRIGVADSVLAPQIDAVQSVLGSASLGKDALFTVRNALLEAFPGAVRLESTAIGYKSVWCPIEELWVKVCCNAATYVIDFASLGRVAVHVEELVLIEP